jgi:hypothetical protein
MENSFTICQGSETLFAGNVVDDLLHVRCVSPVDVTGHLFLFLFICFISVTICDMYHHYVWSTARGRILFSSFYDPFASLVAPCAAAPGMILSFFSCCYFFSLSITTRVYSGSAAALPVSDLDYDI